MESRSVLNTVRFMAATMVVTVAVGCSGKGGSEFAEGLPNCESDAAREIAKKALLKHMRYKEGDMCFMQDNIGHANDPVGAAGYRPDPLGNSMADCKVAPNGRDFTPVRDFTLTLKDYLVMGEVLAQDSRSVTCEISTAYELSSKEQPRFSGQGATKSMIIRYFRQTESGERRYEASVHR